ncbi:hypothetical protein GJ496_010662 [Pomphorhynchus laevis]|nr:hypothetical protein GJ496_010662 [Pomphorhynchus laevis]
MLVQTPTGKEGSLEAASPSMNKIISDTQQGKVDADSTMDDSGLSKLDGTISKACLSVKYEDLTGSNNNFVGVDNPNYRQRNVEISPAEDLYATSSAHASDHKDVDDASTSM